MPGEEGAPTDLPLEGGDGARHVPIRHDQGAGEATPVDDINPLAPNVDGTNYEMDPARAESMAYAETDFRTKAVENRDAERKPQELVEREAEVKDSAEQLPHPNQLMGRRKRRRLEQKHEDLWNEVENERKADRNKRQLAAWDAAEQFGEDFPEREEDVYAFDIRAHSDPKDRARFYDRQATRIGEWAGVLHDRPLSAEFKKAHPGVQFQPKRLVRMEDEVELLGLKIERYKSASPHSETQTAVRRAIEGDVRDGSETRRLLARAADKEIDDEYERITGGLMEQARALDELHIRLVDQESIQPLRDRLAMTRNLLNDVRNEVGLPVEEVEAEPEAEAPDAGPEAGPKAELSD